MRRRRTYRAFVAPLAALGAYLAFAAYPPLWEGALSALFPAESRVLYQEPMLLLIGEHLAMVALSSVVSTLVGVSLGIFVTRPAGADFYDTVSDIANLGQTFPPVAVLALAVPLVGLGFEPTVLALTLYGILPILQNTIEGVRSVPDSMVESAHAMGLSPRQALFWLELPVAAPIIFAGIRVSVVINVATATIGAVIGAGGLGAPIISGLANSDPAVTLQGGLLAAGLALIMDGLLSAAERTFGRTVSSRASHVTDSVPAEAAA